MNLYLKNVETRSLEEFINFAQEKIDRLIKDAKLAQDSFNQCVEYFGKDRPDFFQNEMIVVLSRGNTTVTKSFEFLLDFRQIPTCLSSK